MASSTIRKALGAVKDQTSIGIAKVTSAVAPELDVAVVKATSHDEEPADERHVREVLHLTLGSRAYVAACVDTVGRRLAKTRDYVVAVKCLALLHRLVAEGDPHFPHELARVSRRGAPVLSSLSGFRDEAHSASWDHSAFVRAYALYLNERVHGILLSLRPSALRPHDGRDAGATAAAASLRDMDAGALLGRMRQLQHQLDRFLSCRPPGAAKHSRVVLVTLYPMVRESFQLYADVCDGLALLLDRFFDMEYPDCVRAFDAYALAARQIDELAALYNWCKDVGVARSSEYPDVQLVSNQLLETLEEFMRERGRRGQSSPPPPPLQTQPAQEPPRRNESAEYDMNGVKALPAPEQQKTTQPEAEKVAVSEPVPKTPRPQVDLVDLREPAATADEQGNKLALALFSGPPAQNGADGSWVAFPSESDSDVTSAWQTPAAEPGKADWELALVETASNLSKQKAALGGGLDPLLLHGMYDQGAVRQQVRAQSASGSASSVALPGHSQGPATPVLALPAPDGTVQTVGGDPFEASLAVPPPAYVQMAEMEKKQRLLVQEQVMWAQYRQRGMQGQANLLVPNPSMAYGMPKSYHGAGGYY